MGNKKTSKNYGFMAVPDSLHTHFISFLSLFAQTMVIIFVLQAF
jgi:hypothetical protein